MQTSEADANVKPTKANSKPKVVKARILGVGLDNEDGHTRLTRGDNFTLYGGSEETHGRMQETAVKVNGGDRISLVNTVLGAFTNKR